MTPREPRVAAARTAGVAILAAPAAVWIGACLDQFIRDCEIDCGDRALGWFLLVMVTAPLFPAGMALMSRRVGVALLVRLGRLVCLLVGLVFVALELALVAGGVGSFVDLVEGDYGMNLDDPEGSRRQAILYVCCG